MSDNPPAPGWFVCPICGLFRRGDPPHGQNTPCPEKVKITNAKLEVLEAKKAHLLGSGMAMNDVGTTLRKMLSKPPFNSSDDDD